MKKILTLAIASLVLGSLSILATASPASLRLADVSLAEGKITMQAPETWVKKEPRTRIVEVEFEVPATEGESDAGRLTIMAAGGTVEQNIDRWKNQFRGQAPVEAKVEQLEVGGASVHIVDISGTFLDSPRGPMGPTVEREGYRMLGAIVQAEGMPAYYVKLTGPQATLEQQAESFKAFIRSVSVAQ